MVKFYDNGGCSSSNGDYVIDSRISSGSGIGSVSTNSSSDGKRNGKIMVVVVVVLVVVVVVVVVGKVVAAAMEGQ